MKNPNGPHSIHWIPQLAMVIAILAAAVMLFPQPTLVTAIPSRFCWAFVGLLVMILAASWVLSYIRRRNNSNSSKGISRSISDQDQIGIVVYGLLVAASLTVILDLIIPSLIAPRGQSYRGEVIKRISTSDKDAGRVLRERNYYQAMLEDVDRRIWRGRSIPGRDPLAPDSLKTLLEAREKLKAINSSKSDVSVFGFSDNAVYYLNITNHFFLLVLLLICLSEPRSGQSMLDLLERARNAISHRSTWIWATWYWVLIDRGTAYLRHEVSPTYATGRRVYFVYNRDISLDSYLWDELMVFAMALLLAALWQVAAELNAKSSQSCNTARVDGKEALRRLPIDALCVSDFFAKWQLQSLLLAGAFLPWTFFDWNFINLTRSEEARYIYFALADHITWITTWVTLSIPVVRRLHSFYAVKSRALCHALSLGSNSKDVFDMIQSIQPVSRFQMMVASAAGATSFLLPLVSFLRH